MTPKKINKRIYKQTLTPTKKSLMVHQSSYAYLTLGVPIVSSQQYLWDIWRFCFRASHDTWQICSTRAQWRDFFPIIHHCNICTPDLVVAIDKIYMTSSFWERLAMCVLSVMIFLRLSSSRRDWPTYQIPCCEVKLASVAGFVFQMLQDALRRQYYLSHRTTPNNYFFLSLFIWH